MYIGRPKRKPEARYKTTSEKILAKRTYDCPNNCGFGPYQSSSALSFQKRKCQKKEYKELLD